MTILLNLPGTSTDTTGLFVAGQGSERQILVTATDFGTNGEVTFELSRTVAGSPVAPASDLAGTPLSINSNRAVNIGPIPVGMQIRAKFGNSGGSTDVRVDIF